MSEAHPTRLDLAGPDAQPPGVTVTFAPDLIDRLAAAVSDRLTAQLARQPSGEPWPEWMSIETAARYLDVSPQRLRKHVAQRRIPFHQEDKGCRVLFRRNDLDDWMSSFHVPARKPNGSHEKA